MRRRAFLIDTPVGGGGSSPIWTPAELNPAVWLDAQTLSAASPWDDLSGNNNDATTISATVALSSDQIGGFQAVDFSGGGRQQLATFIHGVDNRTRTDLIVVKANTLNSTPRHIYGTGSAGAGFVNTYGHGFFYNGSFLGFKCNNASATTGVQLSDFDPSGQVFIALFRSSFDGTTRTNELWINGELAVTDNQNVTPWPYSTSYIGRTSSSITDAWDGSIGEIFSQLSAVGDQDLDRLFGYAAHHWNIASVLPNDHPFKNAAPTLEV